MLVTVLLEGSSVCVGRGDGVGVGVTVPVSLDVCDIAADNGVGLAVVWSIDSVVNLRDAVELRDEVVIGLTASVVELRDEVVVGLTAGVVELRDAVVGLLDICADKRGRGYTTTLYIIC